MTLDNEFVNNNIDTDIALDVDFSDKVEINKLEDDQIDRFHPRMFTKSDIRNLKQMEIDEAIDKETKIINLKEFFLPKGLTPLEGLFDSNDIPKNLKMEPLKSDIEECNIGSKEHPKLIKLSESLPPNEKLKYMELLK